MSGSYRRGVSTDPDPTGDTPLRVRDVLAWPEFPVELVAGSAGLDRPVRWAHPTELIDPSPFLRGGEIILTVGIELRTNADCATFVDALMRRDAAAVGLAVDVVEHVPPDELRRLAEKRSLPLFTVPTTVPFVAFTEKIAAFHARHREQQRRRCEDGRLLDFIRRDLASPWVLRDRLGVDAGAHRFGALCLPAGVPVALDGPGVMGLHRDQLLVVAEESCLTAFLASVDTPVYGRGGTGSLDTLPGSLKECVAAYAMSVQTGTSRGPRDLASFSGLVERMSPEQFAPFRDHVWTPLEQYDARHGTQLVTTVERFLDCDGSLAETARTLYLHVNSVRNRLTRVHAVTGLDPFRFRDRVTLALAAESRRR
jgi:hypothetical protein